VHLGRRASWQPSAISTLIVPGSGGLGSISSVRLAVERLASEASTRICSRRIVNIPESANAPRMHLQDQSPGQHDIDVKRRRFAPRANS